MTKLEPTTIDILRGILTNGGLPYAHVSKDALAAYIAKGWIVPVLSPNGRRSGRYDVTKNARDIIATRQAGR